MLGSRVRRLKVPKLSVVLMLGVFWPRLLGRIGPSSRLAKLDCLGRRLNMATLNDEVSVER
jgi:hypothetical protein